MTQAIQNIVDRQDDIALGAATPLPLPKFDYYTICNLRGGIGKTSLAFNLSFGVNNLLVADTCPQGNLSYFYDNNYYQNARTSINDMLLPYFVAGLGTSGRVSCSIDATNAHFAGKGSFYLPSSSDLYMLPSQMANALVQANTLPAAMRPSIIDKLLFSLKTELAREMATAGTSKCLIDTSPFFSGATHLAWHATDALIVPVRTDQQSVNSLELLLRTLSNSASEFRRVMPTNQHEPKIQMVVLTHCGWSTRSGARNEPNQQTKVYLEKIRDIVSRNIGQFTTQNPDNHIVLLDDFLGTGRISSAQSKPIALLNAGDTMVIHRVKTSVNESVEKIKKQLEFISKSIW